MMFGKFFENSNEPARDLRDFLESLIKSNHSFKGISENFTYKTIDFLKLNGAKKCKIKVYQVPILKVFNVDLMNLNYNSETKFYEVYTKEETFYINNDFSKNNTDSRTCLVNDNEIIIKIDSSNFYVHFHIDLPCPLSDMLNERR